MNKNILRPALAAMMLAAADAASADVAVNFKDPDNFTDLPRTPWQRQQALDDIAAHFRELGKTLPPGQDLVIDVLDIDLAGRERPNGLGPSELRILTGGADWPRMRLRYALTGQGRILQEGEAELSDKNYANHINTYPSDVRWPHEKQMIDDWWRTTLGPRAGAR